MGAFVVVNENVSGHESRPKMTSSCGGVTPRRSSRSRLDYYLSEDERERNCDYC